MTITPLSPRYDLLGTLGEGGMGQVFRVHDRESDREVALKRLRLPGGADDAQARFLFKQEFWAMASLRHPHLVEALDFGEGPDGVPHMAMAIVPGADLDVSPPGQDEAAVRAWLPQIASALAHLHGRGFVHGDLKPDNIRLTPDGTAMLMDLGLLAPAGRAGEPIRGSIAYMAPEVIRQGAIDARTDLYALGAVLYHALTGRPPFDHATPMVVLRAHLDAKPERAQARREGISDAMNAAIMRLLAKDPSARFSSVGALLEALGLEGAHDERVGLLASPLLGREPVQAALRAASGLDPDTATGRLWLVGPAGSGKSRLLGEARAEAQLAGRPAIALRGFGADAAPYQALQPLFRSLADTALTHQPGLAPVLARVLPELNATPAAPLDGVAERLRLQAAIAALSRAAHPRALWLIDAADALDAASLELLQALQKESAADWAWLWAGETASAPGLHDTPTLTVEPLDDESLLAIARQQLGHDLPEGLADRLLPLSAGLPGAVEALLGHWIQSGALTRSAGRWQATGAFELPGGLRVALDARLQALGSDARHVARVAAILVGSPGTELEFAL